MLRIPVFNRLTTSPCISGRHRIRTSCSGLRRLRGKTFEIFSYPHSFSVLPGAAQRAPSPKGCRLLGGNRLCVEGFAVSLKA